MVVMVVDLGVTSRGYFNVKSNYKTSHSATVDGVLKRDGCCGAHLLYSASHFRVLGGLADRLAWYPNLNTEAPLLATTFPHEINKKSAILAVIPTDVQSVSGALKRTLIQAEGDTDVLVRSRRILTEINQNESISISILVDVL